MREYGHLVSSRVWLTSWADQEAGDRRQHWKIHPSAGSNRDWSGRFLSAPRRRVLDGLVGDRGGCVDRGRWSVRKRTWRQPIIPTLKRPRLLGAKPSPLPHPRYSSPRAELRGRRCIEFHGVHRSTPTPALSARGRRSESVVAPMTDGAREQQCCCCPQAGKEVGGRDRLGAVQLYSFCSTLAGRRKSRQLDRHGRR